MILFVPEHRKEQIERALTESRMTTLQLAEEMCVSQNTAGHWMRLLRSEDMVHVADWVQRNSKWTPVYAWGRGVDVPKPKQKGRRVKVNSEERVIKVVPFKLAQNPFDAWLFKAREEMRLAA